VGGVGIDVAVARAAFRRYSSYRAATVAGILTNTFFGTLLTSAVIAVAGQRDEISGYSRQDLVTQTWVMQGLLVTIAIWGWTELGDRIRTGDIAVDLARPMDLQRWWLAHDLGRAAYHALVRGTAPFVIASLLFSLRLPTKVATVPLFVSSVALAVTVSFSLRYLVNLAAFWIGDVRGITRLAMAVWSVLSGATISLAFFPEHWQAVIRLLPFAQMMQAPVDVWLERRVGLDSLTPLAMQLGWAVAILAIGRATQARGVRVAVMQGG
jgi:ABC-2 type transport system permease protein